MLIQFVHNHAALIHCLLNTEGFIASLISGFALGIDAPHYSLLCKRQKTLNIPLPKSSQKNEPIHVVCNSTGLQVFGEGEGEGEGEWNVRQHGYIKKRLWRKLHLAINSKTHLIEASELTSLGTQDCQGFDALMNQIDNPILTATGDGAYDRFSCYETMEKKGGIGIFPSQRNAATSTEKSGNKRKASPNAVAKRDKTVLQVRALGRTGWKEQVGYHKRSLAEAGMFRIKTLVGSRLSSHLFENQQVEVKIWCRIINKMPMLGMPETIPI